MKTLLIALSALMITACGKAPGFQDPQAVQYVKNFEQAYGVDASWINVEIAAEISYSDVDEGTCDNGNITLNPRTWDMLTITSKQTLIDHELGHCFWGRHHNNDSYSDGCPKSIMNQYLVNDFCYNLHQGAMIEELIHGQ